MYRKRKMLKNVGFAGTLATIVALISRLAFDWSELLYVAGWSKSYAYVLLGMLSVVGVVFMSPILSTPIRLLGCIFFGAGFGGLVINKFVQFCMECNESESTILLYEVLYFAFVFLFSGLMYARQVKNYR